ncbi:hypothetical protein SAMN04489713_109241 [Actinomadura madurae]|uniref:Serine/threonine protein kinase n=1 Tax=Actinomadura madurae TaxID=1993 RepID=A0A1I5JXE0_9ACTN|nr:hypothetical protein [Actinomadura madurae]SFO77472.1 hypothetical protein SAMN04489713_109241 [Actinomadura madurae]
MSRPLPPGDPAQLGPFRLSARLSESAAGIVFLGVDGEGRRASVAVLNQGAAGDAAARDRFRAAINAAVPGPGRPVGDAGGAAPVVAAQPDGPAPWVATLYESDRAGAERFLEPVVFQGSGRAWWGGRRRGPQFQPYWLGSGEPALERPRPVGVPGPVGERPPERNLVAAVLALAAVLAVLALLMGLLFACQPAAEEPPPPPPEPTPTFQQPSRSPTPSPTSPTPSPSQPPSSPGTPSPSPSGTGGDDGAPL